MRYRLWVIALAMLAGLCGTARAQDSTWRFNPEALLFFHNNEFSGEKVNGYTLPGFVLRPKVVWTPDDRLTVEGGIHWLYYWGADRYPDGVDFGALAYPSDTAGSLLHIRLWMRASVRLLPELRLILGSLDNVGHGLPRPLYNPELDFTADPGAGVQLLLDTKHFTTDLWVDWRDFIFPGSPTQERLLSGLSAEYTLDAANWRFYLPVHLVIQHQGGQSLVDTMPVRNTFNGSVGFGVGRRVGKARLSAELHAMGYRMDINYHHPWTKAGSGQWTVDGRQFDKGWGLYALARAQWDFGLLAELSFWRGEAFVPLLGSAHYSNVSVNTPGLTFDCMDVITLRTAYTASQWSKLYSVTFAGLLYAYLPFSGDRPGYPKVERGMELSYTFGAYIHLNPTL